MYNSVASITFTVLLITTLQFQNLPSPQKQCLYPSNSHSPSLPPPTPRQPRIYFLSLNLLILGLSHKHTHRLCSLLSLVSFTQDSIFKVPAFKRQHLRYQHSNFLLVFSRVSPLLVLHPFLGLHDIPSYGHGTRSLSALLPVDIGLFPLFGYYEERYYECLCTRFCVDVCFHCSIPRSEIAGSCRNSMLKLLKIARQFSKVAESFFIPTSSVGEFQFLHFLTYTCCFLTF